MAHDEAGIGARPHRPHDPPVNAERLARVADVLAETDGPPVLDRLLGFAVELLGMTSGGIAIVGDGQHRGAVAVTDPTAAAVDDLQFSLGEGPCLDVDRGGAPILEPDLRDAVGQWPAFAPAAMASGVRAVFAFPLRIGAVGLGVLTVYRDLPGDLDEEDLADAVVLARVATHVLLAREAGATPGALPSRLVEVVNHRAHVHQATGMVAVQLEADLGTALTRLRAFSWAHDRSIDDVAADVVARRLRFGTT